MQASTESIEGLRAKYTEIRRLRLAHDSAADARPALARLARRFPGALRELDALPMAAIESRLTALEHAARDPSQRQPWMQAQAEFHALTRGALATKRWLGKRPSGAPAIDAPTIDRFITHALAHHAERVRQDELLVWARDLASVARPPRGKLTHVVFAKLGERLGVTADAARALVVPSRPR